MDTHWNILDKLKEYSLTIPFNLRGALMATTTASITIAETFKILIF